jgi:hypothetical protein
MLGSSTDLDPRHDPIGESCPQRGLGEPSEMEYQFFGLIRSRAAMVARFEMRHPVRGKTPVQPEIQL